MQNIQQYTKDYLAPQIVFIILGYMVIKLDKDNLSDYMSEDQLIVFYKTDWCNSCRKQLPNLYNIPDDYTVVIVDAERHIRSSKFMPGGVKAYPTIAYFEKGYFRCEYNVFELEKLKDQL